MDSLRVHHAYPLSPRRMAVVAVLFFLCAMGIVARLFGITVLHRRTVLEAMARDTCRMYQMPAIRGRLLDRNGVPLAWSVRRFDLWWRPPRNASRRQRDITAFRAVFPRYANSLPRRVTTAASGKAGPRRLVAGVDPGLLARFRVFCAHYSRFEVRSTFVRRHAGIGADLLRKLGRTRLVNGVEVGISGAEKAHDEVLRGRPGVYSVTVDKHGRWIPSTWRKLQDMRPGYDVYLPLRVGRVHAGIGSGM